MALHLRFTLKETFYSNALGLFGYLEEVKVDFVHHDKFPMLQPIEEINGIRLFGDEDLMAMKAAAILRRAVKKDFWDVAELLKHYSLENFISAYIENTLINSY